VIVVLTDGHFLDAIWRPRRVFLRGAQVYLRPDAQGRLTVRASDEGVPITLDRGQPQAPLASGAGALAAWLSSLDGAGLDGATLGDVALRETRVVIETSAGKRAAVFDNLGATLSRPAEGGVALTIDSSGRRGPWSVTLTAGNGEQGAHTIETVARNLAPEDILAALGAPVFPHEWTTPVSLVARADVTGEGMLRSGQATLRIGAGRFASTASPASGLDIAEGQFDFAWDATTLSMLMPVGQIAGPAGSMAISGRIVPPSAEQPIWLAQIDAGRAMLSGQEALRDPPLLVDRIGLRASFHPSDGRLVLERGEVGSGPASVIMSGELVPHSESPILQFGLAATRMPVATFRRLWPAPILPETRAWVSTHVLGGHVEKTSIAINAPVRDLADPSRPLTENSLRIEIDGSGVALRPILALPALQGNDLALRVTGKTVRVTMPRAEAVTAGQRDVALSDLLFEVTDTNRHPAQGRTRLKFAAAADAVAEILSLDALKGATGLPLDPAQVNGQISGVVSVGFPLMKDIPRQRIDIAVDAEATNLVVERIVGGARLEGGPRGLVIAGNGRLGGAPVTVDYRRPRPDADGDIKLTGTFDEAARGRLGIDLSSILIGPVAVRIAGKLGDGARDDRLAVDVDLAQARILETPFGWSKASGRPLKASFVWVTKGKERRLDDVQIDGSGLTARGTVEFDEQMVPTVASFPQFGLSDSDKGSLRVDQTATGPIKVTWRAEIVDLRPVLRSALTPSTAAPSRARRKDRDLDIEARIATAIGHNGEVLRNVEVRGVRRGGQWRTLSMSGRGVRDATLSGDLRQRPNGKQALYIESSDAGALFRFLDLYSKMVGGRAWISMDPPGGEQTSQDGIIGIADFAIRGEGALEQVAAGQGRDGRAGQPAQGGPIAFTRLRAEFTRAPGRLTLRDGVVLGPTLGATVEGQIEGARDEVRVRGTLIPAYALNNLFARLPILGPILGGGANEGLVGVTYEVTGPLGNPTMRISPMSAVAPGFLRRLFDFRGNEPAPPAFADPGRP
jgi:hypothetical protein